ncbi:MAG: septum formation initiator family protein [Pseudomonadota bacterium]
MDRFNWRQILIPAAYVLLVGVIAIFAHSGLQGTHGLAAYRDASIEERRLMVELEAVRAEREALANKVRRMSDRYLDLDLLDERARAVLGRVRPDEIVIH